MIASFGRLGASLSSVLIAVTLTSLVSCGQTTPAYERALRAFHNEGDIVIGVAWPFASDPDLFLEGVRMAVDEVNAGGGIDGRMFAITVKDDGNTAEQGQVVAEEFVADPDLVAVIGHRSSKVALPLSIVYEHQGILFITPGATVPYLTLHGFKNVFRIVPNDQDYAAALANISAFHGFKKIRTAVILATDDVDGASFATNIQYEVARTAGGIEIVSVESFNARELNFRTVLARIANLQYDAIFLQCPEPPAGQLIRQAREMGIRAPFVGKGSLSTLELWKSAGAAAEGTLVATNYSPDDLSTASIEFHEKFFARYNRMPDVRAARGYDAIHTLAEAMKLCKTSNAFTVRDTLRYNFSMPGVTGLIKFDEHGDLLGENIFFKILRHGAWDYPRFGAHEASSTIPDSATSSETQAAASPAW